MNRFHPKRLVLLAAFLCLLMNPFITGCGSGGSAPVVALTRSYVGTQSPGDVWSWTLTDTTFTATNETTGFTYSGAAVLLPSSFHKLTIASSTDPNVAVGSIAYCFEVPGVALIAKPAGMNTHPVVASGLGGCPNANMAFNWISIPRANWNSALEAYGTFNFAISGNNSLSVQIAQFDVNGNALGMLTMPGVTCTNGRFTGSNGTAVITPAGVVIADNGPGQGGLVGVKIPAAPVDLAALAAKNFRGILFKGGGGSQLVQAVPNGDGTLHGSGYSDVDNNVAMSDGGSGVTLSFLSQPSPGLILGTLSNQSGTTPIVLVANKVDGKYMIFGFSAENNSAPDNFLVMEK